MQLNNYFSCDAIAIIPSAPHLITVNTTSAADITITAKWHEAHASNLFTNNQGHVECIDNNK